jgi:hypothetical protein
MFEDFVVSVWMIYIKVKIYVFIYQLSILIKLKYRCIYYLHCKWFCLCLVDFLIFIFMFKVFSSEIVVLPQTVLQLGFFLMEPAKSFSAILLDIFHLKANFRLLADKVRNILPPDLVKSAPGIKKHHPILQQFADSISLQSEPGRGRYGYNQT